MPGTIVFLVAGLTAIIGPLVDAPATLTSLAACVALVAGWLTMNSIRKTGNGTKPRTSAPVKSQEETQTDATQPGSPGGPEFLAPQPAPSTEIQVLQGRLRMESMRVQSLETELQEFRQRNDELMRERVDLIRQASSATAGDSLTKPAQRAESGIEFRESHELHEGIRQRDEWINAQQTSLDDFRAGIGQVEHALLASLTNLERLTSGQLASPAHDDKHELGIQTKLSGLIATLERAKSVTPPADDSRFEFKVPGSIDHVFAALLKLHNRLEETADHAKVAAMNARILKDRPIEPDTPELLESLAIETTSIASDLEKIGTLVSPLAPELESLRRDLDLCRESLVAESSRINAESQATRERAGDLASSIQQQVDHLGVAIDAVVKAGKARRAGLEDWRAAMDEVVDSLTGATGTAKSLALSVERMIEVSRLATAGRLVIRTPQATALDD